MVTFVFTDIEGSTRHLRELGDAYDELLDIHHATLRRAWEAHDGHEVNTEGDAFFVAFSDAAGAIAAVVDAQRRLAAVTWPRGRDLRVRIGVHSGFARPTSDDYRALAVNQAARVVSAAHGGQILLTADVAHRLAPPWTDALVPLGRYRLRDFDEPVALFTVVAPGLSTVDIRPRARPADGHNMVRPLTTLIGRDGEVAALRDLVRPRRLVTIAGPGGVGKTRLAIEVGIGVVADWPDGVWFVDLAPLSSADAIPMAIADAIGAPVPASSDAWEAVLDHVRDRTALVILDNCEHLLAGAARHVTSLVTSAASLGILATSRSPLGLRAETVFRLGLLPTGALDAAAVTLFLDRAGHGERELDRGEVQELCAALDGLPLAIELAAARASAVPLRAIVDRVRRSHGGLTSSDPGVPDRQRSLERTLDWSYQLLAPPAQAVLRRLAVFAGGFDDAAAEAACADGVLVRSGDVAEELWTLLSSSLVRSDAADGPRYRLLHTVRAYAAARTEPDEARATVRRLATHYESVLGPEHATGPAWVQRMRSDLDNLRHVVERLARDPDAGAVELAQRLAWAIGCLHDTVDTYRAGVPEVRQFVSLLAAPSPARVGLLALLADLHFRLNETEEAQPFLAEAEHLAGQVGHPEWDDAALARGFGELATRRGDTVGAIRIAREGLATSRSARSRARLFNLLGIALLDAGAVREAIEAFREEVDATRAAGMLTFEVNAHGNLAEALLREQDHTGAAAEQLACLDIARSMRQPVQIAFSIIVAARLAAAEHDWQEATRLHAAADVLLGDIGIAMYDSDLAQSLALYDEARRVLGVAEFDAALAAGRVDDVDDAADRATAQLRRTAARLPTTSGPPTSITTPPRSGA